MAASLRVRGPTHGERGSLDVESKVQHFGVVASAGAAAGVVQEAVS